MAKDVAAVVGLVTRQMSPEVEEALEEEKEDYGVERDWTLSFLDSLVLDNLASGKIPYKPRNTKTDSVEGSSGSLVPALENSAGLSESISTELPSLNSSGMFSSSRGEPASLWTLEGRLEVSSSSSLEMSAQISQFPKPQELCGGLDGLLEEGWS